MADGEPGYITDKQAALNRLRRIEGQVRGLQRMVDEDAYCIDILTQVSAATRALENVALSLLDQHLHHCVAGGTSTVTVQAQRRLDESEVSTALDEAGSYSLA